MTIDQRRTEELATAHTAFWNMGKPKADAGFFAESGRIVINRGAPWEGRGLVAEMAVDFFADVPDLHLTCDKVRAAGDHVAYLWTLAGRHSGIGNRLRIPGLEAWDLDPDLKVSESRGRFDAADDARQVAGD
jgi:uncharacterized protein (TIGR02246 family)